VITVLFTSSSNIIGGINDVPTVSSDSASSSVGTSSSAGGVGRLTTTCARDVLPLHFSKVGTR
jgi:hypothetical protein